MWYYMNYNLVKSGLLIIIALAWLARLHNLGDKSLWFDEIVIVALARIPWYEGLVAALSQGFQLTPLFQWVIKLWLAVGDSEWLLRVPAVATSVLTVPLLFKLGRRFFDEGVAWLAAFIFAINPYQVWYGQELKLYALLTFASTGAMLAFSRMLRTGGRKGSGSLLFFNLLGFPTHYFMFLISAVQFLYLIITLKQTYRLLRPWLAAQGVAVLPLIPWWLFIIQQRIVTVGIGWVPWPEWLTPWRTLWDLNFGYSGELSPLTVLGLTVMAVGLGLGVWRAWSQSKRGWLLILWLFFPPLITGLMSLGRISFYVDRYLLIITPALTIVIVAGLLSLRAQLLRWGTVLIFTMATAFGLRDVYSEFVKDDWRAIARQVDRQAQAGDLVITCADGYHLAFEYYNPHRTLKAKDVIYASQVAEVTKRSLYKVAWVVALHPRMPAHNLARDTRPVLDPTTLSPEAAAWATARLQSQVTAPGISAYRYGLSNALALEEVVAWHCRDDKFF